MLCCLRRNDEASCHTLRHHLPPSANIAAYQRLVSSTRYGPSQLSVLHLAFTARDEARYWLRIAISAYSTCIRRPVRGGFLSEYCHDVWYENKLEWRGYPATWRWKKCEDKFIRFDRIHKRDRRTDTAWRHRPRLRGNNMAIRWLLPRDAYA